MAGTEKWDYNPSAFNSVDKPTDGLLNSTELESYFKTLYTNANTRSNYQSASDYLANADINGDGLISKGEIALYKSGQDHLTEDIFKKYVNTDTIKDASGTPRNQAQWNDLQKDYNIYDSKDIISKGEIMEHDKDLYRTSMSFSSTTFNAADANRDGFLDQSEMKTYLENSYGTCSDKQINYTFDQLDANKDGLISDGEIAVFKLKNNPEITVDKLKDAGFAESDAKALVSKYATEGRSSFNATDVKNKDDTSIDNTKNGISVGGIIALIVCCLIVVGLIAWGIWWLNKDDKKKETEQTSTKGVSKKVDSNLRTVNDQGQQAQV